ncbi:alpha-keto acid decarboxylase family protein [Lactobacillus sp. Sy-1]|uniref:alpha-keto acid decarboxylase family protein n=1 Tax=Lactobacillus sp. Sy-1 TaxID=2109645 RepID=UPI001C5B505C|nr:thiamine pyrophosphate-binding protein [Lactobacillus sp. Sy-1]MBW1606191.1 alpha-keto acid decarboxylase family protein [Lactobacillus sp. Sy-1]
MYTLADYLVDVIKFMNCDEVFGVPGDYNLDFLDHIVERDDMHWAGNANELNAAYMADGYARKRGFAALVTTFGVGDLSSDNGLAGSLAENVPVLSIVGAPKTTNMEKHLLVHHSFGDGDFDRFTEMHRVLGLNTRDLTFDHPVDDINELVQSMINTGKPAYLTLPIDVAKMPVSEKLRDLIPSQFNLGATQTPETNQLVDTIMEFMNQSKHPLVLVGHELKHLHLGASIAKFIQNNQLPFTDLALGKAAVDEGLPQFIGTYNGALSTPKMKSIVDSADLVLSIGAKLTDFVTAMFTQSFDDRKMISINNESVDILGVSNHYMNNYNFKSVVTKLAEQSLSSPRDFEFQADPVESLKTTDAPLSQDFYDQALMAATTSGETLVAESGTSFSGLSPLTLKPKMDFVAQPLWASIGYAFPAMIGSQLADPKSRHILSTGEGSLQLTIQELGMLIKNNLHPIIIIIDNHGYTVERLIHGMNAVYNDVPSLNYTLMPKAFGASDDQYLAFDVNTENEFTTALQEAKNHPEKLILIQAHMQFNDSPASLSEMGELISKRNN